VPFIARYRKEVTGALDDAQLRTLEERLRYLRELDERRDAIRKEITAQGKLTDELEAQIRAADSKARLEDLYLPYKPKRRTKAQIAREAGLESLADLLLRDPTRDPHTEAANFVDPDKNVADANAALDGARAILVERFGEDADLLGGLRESMAARGSLTSKVREGQERNGAKFADYFEFSEPFTRLPSHRVLALFRGEKEEILDLTLDPGADDAENEARIAERFGIRDEKRPADPWLNGTVHWAWRTRILMHLSVDIRVRLWQVAEDEAVRVFAANLRDLLLAAPAGARTTMGLDPGFRTGVKVAITDATGKVLATATIYPHEPPWHRPAHLIPPCGRDARARRDRSQGRSQPRRAGPPPVAVRPLVRPQRHLGRPPLRASRLLHGRARRNPIQPKLQTRLSPAQRRRKTRQGRPHRHRTAHGHPRKRPHPRRHNLRKLSLRLTRSIQSPGSREGVAGYPLSRA
jgi:transcriptional accessory protein Tex/SPT6